MSVWRNPASTEPLAFQCRARALVRRVRRGASTMALLGCIMMPAAAEGQETREPGPGSPDFLFGRPASHLGISIGRMDASERGDIFDFTREHLTVDQGDFDTTAFRLAYGHALNSRLEVLGEFERSDPEVMSEFRAFTESGQPIVQTTELDHRSLAATLRVWARPRGREVGRFAWVPTRIAAYVGAGGGAYWYRFRQTGDFVDFVDYSIFTEQLRSSGWTTNSHILGGVSIALTKQLFLITEGRYVWASKLLGDDFVGFEDIDLGGLRTTAGIEFVF